MRLRRYQWIYAVSLGLVLPYFMLNVTFKKGDISIQEKVTESVGEDSCKEIGVLLPGGESVVMLLDDYVTGVVLAEMPAAFESEALKAQAVLARTYALKKASTEKHRGGLICTEASCCQGFCSTDHYNGSTENLEKVKEAVKATEGQVLTYQGELIEATYFSCSGGRTEDAVAVWGTEVPYLKSKESPGEEGSDRFTSTIIMDRTEFVSELGLADQAVSITHVTYTDGGGVQEIWFGDKSFSGVQVREMLQLPSTAFQMNIVGNSVIITSKGYGHRVGMSQYGANAMALQGSDYRQILAYYYENTMLIEELD